MKYELRLKYYPKIPLGNKKINPSLTSTRCDKMNVDATPLEDHRNVTQAHLLTDCNLLSAMRLACLCRIVGIMPLILISLTLVQTEKLIFLIILNTPL